MKKKGMVTFGNVSTVILSLVIAVLIVAAGVVALDAFKSGQTNASVNETIDNGITMAVNFSAQLGTVGTMIGIGLLLVIIVGVFYLVARGKGGGI